MSAWRPSGIVVIGLLVASGVGVTAGYMQWKAPEVGEIIAGRKREIAAAPKTPEGRLTQWLVYGAPQIHHRLTLMRFSAEQPWLVTHAVGRDARNLAIYGIDLSSMPKDVARIEGTVVRMRFPRPVLLARGPLTGSNAISVPIAAAEENAPDGTERARYLIGFALDGLTQALERDIPEAQVSIGIGPEESWAEITADLPRADLRVQAFPRSPGIIERTATMARANNKSGGPTRGRKLIRKLGMNSGKRRGKLRQGGR